MLNKGRKLVALLTMLALIFTYSFSVSGISVYAEEQGDANAKSAAAEEKAPAEPKEDKDKEPAPAPAPTPAPADEEVGGSGDSGSSSNNDQEVKEEVNEEEEVLEEDPDAVLEEVLEEAVKAPPRDHGNVGPLAYNGTATLKPYPEMTPGAGEVEHWEFNGADGCYSFNESTHVITNQNKTGQQKTVVVTHSIDKTGIQGSTRSEKWTVRLNSAAMVNIQYYDWKGSVVHTDRVTNVDPTTIWGIPTRPGFMFLGWALVEPYPESTFTNFAPGESIVPRDYARYISYSGGVGTLKLYSVWHRTDLVLGPVTGKTATLPYTGSEQVLEGIVEGPDNEGYSLFKTVDRPHGSQTYHTYYYVKTADVYAKGKEPGDYDTAVTYAKVYVKYSELTGGIRDSGMYVQVNPGTLTIEEEQEMTLNTYGYSGPYDGRYKTPSATCSESDATISWRYKKDGEWTEWSSDKPFIRNVGTLEFEVKAEKEGFKTVTTGSRYIITKASLTITVKDQEYSYDGQPHGLDGREYTFSSPDDNNLVTFSGKGAYDYLTSIYMKGYKETDAGTYEKTLAVNERADLYMAYKPNNQYEPGDEIVFNVRDNYDVSFVKGDLIINPKEVTVSFIGTKKTEDYDATEKTNDEYSFECSDRAYKLDWVGFTKKPVLKKTNAGEYALGLTFKDMYNNTDEYPEAKNFNVTFSVTSDLELIINKAEVTLTALDQEYTYNGEPQGEPGGEYTGVSEVAKVVEADGLQGNDKLYKVYMNEAMETEPNVYEDAITIDESEVPTVGGQTKMPIDKNYEVTYEPGTLTINPETAEVIFKLNGGELDGSTEDIVIEANVGETITAPEAPTKKGYEFQYWKGSKLDPGQEYVVKSGGHTFTALWASNGSSDGDSNDNVKTADTFGLIGIVAMLAAALLGLITLAVTRRREE